MNKVLIVSLFLAVFASSVYAAQCMADGKQVFCQYDTGCWAVKSTDDSGAEIGCSTQAGYCASLFSGGTESPGDGTKLQCTDNGNTAFTCNNCNWSNSTATMVDCFWAADNCWEKPSDQCSGGDPLPSGSCSGGKLTGGTAPTVTYCEWSGGGGCHRLENPDGPNAENPGMTNLQACQQFGTVVSSCGGTTPPPGGTTPPPGGTTPPPGGTTPPPGGTQPIIKTLPGMVAGNALTTMSNAVNLQVKSNATFSIYDMKGNMLRTQKVGEGNHVVQLQLPRGLYVVKATSGSWQQTVKVMVK